MAEADTAIDFGWGCGKLKGHGVGGRRRTQLSHGKRDAPILRCNIESQRRAAVNACIKGDSKCRPSSNDTVLATSKSTSAKAESVKGRAGFVSSFPNASPNSLQPHLVRREAAILAAKLRAPLLHLPSFRAIGSLIAAASPSLSHPKTPEHAAHTRPRRAITPRRASAPAP